MERYTDTISGEELYVYKDSSSKRYYKDKTMRFTHRQDGPAIEGADGYKAWWVDGKRHRLDGPAYENAYGDKAWYVNGKRHRLDGPAVEYADADKVWYVDDKFIMLTNNKGKIKDRMK